jgi:hypothetical protein
MAGIDKEIEGEPADAGHHRLSGAGAQLNAAHTVQESSSDGRCMHRGTP